MRNVSLAIDRFYALVVFIVVSLSACKSSVTISTSFNQIPNNNNNVIKVNSTNTTTSSNSGDKIIFEGKNNLFEIIQQNSAYFDESHDVIIVKGNKTIIKLINVNIIDLSSGKDTLIIVGNKKKYVMDVRNSIVINKKKIGTDTVNLKETTFNTSSYSNEFIGNNRPTRFDYFDSLVSVSYAYNYFLNGLKTEEPEYYYQLAEMYLYGLGINESAGKAIELYEYAAAKDHVRSLIKLGDIFKGSFSVKPDRNKALYFYKRCQILGDSYCDEQVKTLR